MERKPLQGLLIPSRRGSSSDCAAIVAIHRETGRAINQSGPSIMPAGYKARGWMLHCGRSVVILGMSLSTFTVVHVVLSLARHRLGRARAAASVRVAQGVGPHDAVPRDHARRQRHGPALPSAVPALPPGPWDRRRLAAGLRADPAGALSPSAGRPVARDLRRRCRDPALSQRLHRRHAGLRQDRLLAPAAGDDASARRRSSRICSCWRSRCGWPSTHSPTFSPASPPPRRARPRRTKPLRIADRWG